MFTKRIIPCLDVNNGRVVKGVNFVDLRMPETRWRLLRLMIRQEQMNLFFWILQLHPMKKTVVDMVRKVAEKCVYSVYCWRRNPDSR